MKKLFILFFILLNINIANAMQFCDKNAYINHLKKETGEDWKSGIAFMLMFQGIQIEPKDLDIDVFLIEKIGNNKAKCGVELKNKGNVLSESTTYHRIIGERSKFAEELYGL